MGCFQFQEVLPEVKLQATSVQSFVSSVPHQAHCALLDASGHGHVGCRFDISVTASPLDVVHYTVDPDDPSNGVCLSMQSGSWEGDMLMNQPAPLPAHPHASAAEKRR